MISIGPQIAKTIKEGMISNNQTNLLFISCSLKPPKDKIPIETFKRNSLNDFMPPINKTSLVF